MYIRSFLSGLLRLLVPIALCSTLYLYLYPIFHGCAFPSTDSLITTALRDSARQHGWGGFLKIVETRPSLAPFRLLILADPQLEGDSSLPKREDGFLPRLVRHWEDVRNTRWDDLRRTLESSFRIICYRDVPDAVYALRKRLDLFGNDYYLAHTYRTLHWWTKPTHITVLGDLIGSQWVTDEEFAWRGWRYWNRVFAGSSKLSTEEIMLLGSNGHQEQLSVDGNVSWNKTIVNIAGNHDIGYAGDISRKRMDRFERVFGKANWDVRFQYPQLENTNMEQAPSLHMIILNSLSLDTPALDESVQHESYGFINEVIADKSRAVEDRSSFTLLLTHLPLHKEAGVCVDSPYFDFWGDDDGGGVYRPHGLKEQNHLSDNASRQGILEALFGMSGARDAPAGGRGRNGLILNGHDHEGCDVWHHLSDDSIGREDASEEDSASQPSWRALRWAEKLAASSQIGIREVTMRSMMGEFGGYAGLLSAWFDFERGEWQYDISMCSAGVQHIWWAIHVLDIVVGALVLLRAVVSRWPRDPARSVPATIASSTSQKIKTET